MSKPSRFTVLATSLYDGPRDGTPRYRESIIAELARALESTHSEGRAEGEAAARERVLREALAIATGLRQSLDARVRDLERELADHLQRAGKVST